ncbi:Holliday junction branch migration protein RuvA [Candidatus Persebacteraceae bacterium Df01]|jgi:Holliday junction DNA helicase RuvA|uniref:Holliday junction branch migration complex subunit RuvA n=1 Tax=Candidatus Doriopsillibacter californiensis TaxID=2970740 RepID=A0ABT7QN37_9GAMM|nr:Holliday junction branch migration protein RuvA [Candidatus Persebacteraceae bacterium Df01]
MIVFLRGKLAAKSTTAAVIDCSGVGYEALAPLTTIEKLPAVGEQVFLHIDMVVREDSQTLYGFSNENEREIFRRLIKVSGVGAKTALALMSALSLDELLSALANSEADRLARAPGIGKKTAERIIVDFRGSPLLEMPTSGEPAGGARDVEQALAGLGYKKAEITRALGALPTDIGTDTTARLRAALQVLSGKNNFP